MSSVLLLEYFHAYGPAYASASASMLTEGRAMLLSVLEDLRRLPEVHVAVAMCAAAETTLGIDDQCVVQSGDPQSLDQLVATVVGDLSETDVVLAIAPETGGVLTSLAQNFRRRGFRFLGPRTEVIEACSDKWQTYELLRRRGLPTITTELATNSGRLNCPSDQTCVVKPRDGAGCEGVLCGRVKDILSKHDNDAATLQQLIIQPFVSGTPLSVAMIGQGRGHSPLFLPASAQNVEWTDSGPHYHGGTIPAELPASAQEDLTELCHRVAWALQLEDGYVGLDMVFRKGELLVIEINPRLCTGYVGYRAATMHNLMTSMLQTSVGESLVWQSQPLTFTCNGDVATA
ncbi:MAG: ATP-grasp domain-containing protein [Fuerstiella sp.]|nr:ATP-grasp domain-containing protein [Fuerstiella sp.]